MQTTPRAPLTNFNDGGVGGGGGSDRGSYFIPEKITTSEFVDPKISLHFLAYPKKSLRPFFATQKFPLFFATQENPGAFHRPKKVTFGQNFRPKNITRTPPPPVIKICEWSPWADNTLYEVHKRVIPVLQKPLWFWLAIFIPSTCLIALALLVCWCKCRRQSCKTQNMLKRQLRWYRFGVHRWSYYLCLTLSPTTCLVR